MPRVYIREPLRDRVERQLDKSGECWVWLGSRHTYGYGYVNGPGGRKYSRKYYVHRLMYEWHVAPIPAGLSVLHHCDNPPCARPDHLYVGTQADNLADMARRGRSFHAVGELCGVAKYSNATMAEIKRLLAGGERGCEISRRFGLSTGYVSNIKAGRRRAHA